MSKQEKGHVHAEAMLEYAKDAAEHARPWELWQVKDVKNATVWFAMTGNPAWVKGMLYRRKPEQPPRRLGREWPDMLLCRKKAKKLSTVYWCNMDLCEVNPINPLIVSRSDTDWEIGMLHATKQSAEEWLAAVREVLSRDDTSR